MQIRRLCAECGEGVPVPGLALCRECLAEFDSDALKYSGDRDVEAGAGEVLYDDLTADYQGDDWPMVLHEPEEPGDPRSEVFDREEED